MNRDLDRRLDEMFAAVIALDEMSLKHVEQVWDAQDAAARRLAWRNVKRALNQTDRTALMDEMRDRVTRWANDLPSVAQGRSVGGGYLSWAIFDVAQSRVAASRAVLDAAAAMIVGDQLSDDDRMLLLAPISEATGRDFDS